MAASLAPTLLHLMQGKAVPGLSLATLRDGRLGEVLALGTRGAHDPAPVDVHTVFEAASLTKPLVAYLSLQLVDTGRFDLDQPLSEICGPFVSGDAAALEITARHVLTHTCGLPNLVTQATPLKTYFEPGARFSYASTGFGYLQRALEGITGESIEALARRAVFQPFGMLDSSLAWQERFEGNHAAGHDWDGVGEPKRRVAQPHASWSLQTTAADYARFLQAVLAGRGLSELSRHAWFMPVVQPPSGGSAEDLPGLHPRDPEVAWGLGWGLEPAVDCFFHWGHSPGFRAYAVASRESRDAVVWFANSAGGLRFAYEILAMTLPGEHPSLRWMHLRR
jgi:CubicO group peptidase (beta-lactamase class C family)